MRQALLAVLLFSLAACTPFDIAKSILDPSSGPSLEVDTTVGDKEEAVVGRVGDTSEIVSESITGGVNTTNVEEMPPWVVLLLILGWLLPDPKVMYNEIKSWFRRGGR